MAALLIGAGCADAASHHAAGRVAAPRHIRPLIGVGNVPGCLSGSAAGLGVLSTYHASVLRIVVDPRHGTDGQAAPCLQAAVARHYRVHVSINYYNTWSTRQDVAYFRHVLASYARYAWAISIGNEQELNQGGRTASGRAYAAVWRAVEPVVAHLAPHAIRVAGEISPWGINFLRQAWSVGLHGAQAISAHAYVSHYGFDLPSVIAWERHTHLPLWVTEGLGGPGAWPSNVPNMHTVPLSAMTGVSVADAWLG